MKLKALLINDTNLICHHGCTLLMNEIYKVLEAHNIIIEDILFQENNFDHFKIKNRNNYDIALINGEGTIHDSTKKVSEIFNLINRLKKKKIPIILFNSTISNLNKKNLNILKIVDKIYVRESESKKYLKKAKINSTIVPDFLTLLPIQKKKKELKVFVTDSTVIRIRKQLLKFAKKKKFKYQPMLYTNQVKLLYHVVIKIFLKIKINIFLNVYIFFKKKFAEEYKNTIQKTEFLFTGRFHSILIALSSLTPFVTFYSDTYKNKALLRDIGIKNRLINTNQLNNKKFKIKSFSKLEIKNILRYKKISKQAIQKSMDEIVKIGIKKNDKKNH